jgi:hypothetical protein
MSLFYSHIGGRWDKNTTDYHCIQTILCTVYGSHAPRQALSTVNMYKCVPMGKGLNTTHTLTSKNEKGGGGKLTSVVYAIGSLSQRCSTRAHAAKNFTGYGKHSGRCSSSTHQLLWLRSFLLIWHTPTGYFFFKTKILLAGNGLTFCWKD